MKPKELKKLRSNIASTEALLNRAQEHHDAHGHLWTEEYAWHIQADIDVKRYQLEITKLTVKLLTTA